MSAWSGVVGGAIALSFFELIVTNPTATKNTGVLFTFATSVIRRLVDPSVPLIPDLRSQ